MTGFLASVATLDEARLAVDSDVDIIDLKDPQSGALGAVSFNTMREITKFIDGQKILSATIGDITSSVDDIVEAVQKTAETGVSIIKVGMFREIPPGLLEALSEETARGTQIVAVMFADEALRLHSLSEFSRFDFAGVMLDTRDKSKGSLRTLLNRLEIVDFVEMAQALGLICGLAGSLKLADIQPLMLIEPDYLGFRGALCHQGERRNELDINRLREIRARIPREEPVNLSQLPGLSSRILTNDVREKCYEQMA